MEMLKGGCFCGRCSRGKALAHCKLAKGLHHALDGASIVEVRSQFPLLPSHLSVVSSSVPSLQDADATRDHCAEDNPEQRNHLTCHADNHAGDPRPLLSLLNSACPQMAFGVHRA